MVRKPGSGRQHSPVTADEAASRIEWFRTKDSGADEVASWDIKEHLLAAAVLQLLGKGRGVLFSLSWDQTEVRVTVYDGDHKAATRCEDSIEFDDAMAMIAEQARQLDKLPRREWKDSNRR